MFTYILYSVGLFYITLIFYLAVMNIARHKDNLSGIQKIIFTPILVVGIIFNFLLNTFVWTITFLERPKELQSTQRMKRHIDKNTWRGKQARFLCHTFLDQFDPSEDGHC